MGERIRAIRQAPSPAQTRPWLRWYLDGLFLAGLASGGIDVGCGWTQQMPATSGAAPPAAAPTWAASPALASMSGPLPPAQSTAAAPLVLRGVTVIDMRTGQQHRAQTVVVAGNRIRALGNAKQVQVPADAQVVDARGKYLIPGLWDMHVHSVYGYEAIYRSAIVNGITGMREMSSPWLDSLPLRRREIATGARVGPRLLVTGPYLGDTAETRNIAWGIGVATPEAARRVVDSLHAAGVDFIKHRLDDVRPQSRAVFFAIAAEARRLGVPLVGHMPGGVTPGEASDSGQHSIEHEAWTLCKDTVFHWNGQEPPDAATREECARMAARFRRNDTWVSVGSLQILPLCYEPWSRDPLTNDPGRPQHMRAADLMFFPEAPCVNQPAPSPASWAVLPLMIGTDLMGSSIPWKPSSDEGAAIVAAKIYHESPVPYVMARLVAAGLPPLEALRAATLNPAKFLHATDSLGTVAPGMLADLMLLDANPLDNIWNTTKIRAVVADGRYYGRAALDELLDKIDRVMQGLPVAAITRP